MIVLWTKADTLDDSKARELMENGISRVEAKQQALKTAWADFEKNIDPWFAEFKYPPKAYVVFRSKCYLHLFLFDNYSANCTQRCMSQELSVMI